jgi:hypothetical protein
VGDSRKTYCKHYPVIIQYPRGDNITTDKVSFFKEFVDRWGYDPGTARFRNLFIFECASNIFSVLIDEFGPAGTLAAIKPYGNLYGRNIGNIAKEMGLSPGNDVVSVALPYYSGVYATSEGNIKPMEIRDGKAVIELYSCPTKEVGSPPEICAMSHFNAEGICQVINPDYEYVFTHHLNSGDECCRFVVKKKSARLKSKGDEPKTLPFLSMFRKPVEIETEQLGDLERTIPYSVTKPESDLTCLTIATGYFNLFTTASVATMGSQRTMELNEPLARKTGIKLGTKWKEDSAGITDLELTMQKLSYLQAVLNQKGEPAIISGSRIEREIVDCPFKGALPEQCKHLEGVFSGICEAIDPNYEFVYDCMMSKGDLTCHWVVRNKSEVGKLKTEVSIEDDSLGY